jgi:hypothetical protein
LPQAKAQHLPAMVTYRHVCQLHCLDHRGCRAHRHGSESSYRSTANTNEAVELTEIAVSQNSWLGSLGAPRCQGAVLLLTLQPHCTVCCLVAAPI